MYLNVYSNDIYNVIQSEKNVKYRNIYINKWKNIFYGDYIYSNTLLTIGRASKLKLKSDTIIITLEENTVFENVQDFNFKFWLGKIEIKNLRNDTIIVNINNQNYNISPLKTLILSNEKNIIKKIQEKTSDLLFSDKSSDSNIFVEKQRLNIEQILLNPLNVNIYDTCLLKIICNDTVIKKGYLVIKNYVNFEKKIELDTSLSQILKFDSNCITSDYYIDSIYLESLNDSVVYDTDINFKIINNPPNKIDIINISADTDKIILNWVKSNEKDVINYNIYRSNDNMNFKKVGVTDGTIFYDYINEKNIPVYYKISCIDNVMQESELSDSNYIFYKDIYAPATPENLRYILKDDNIILLWDKSKENDIAGYNVYSVVDSTYIKIGETLVPMFIYSNTDKLYILRFSVQAFDNNSIPNKSGFSEVLDIKGENK